MYFLSPAPQSKYMSLKEYLKWPAIAKICNLHFFSWNFSVYIFIDLDYEKNAYKIFVSEKHTGKPPKYTSALNNILNKYGKFTTHSGRVAQYVLNFYYPHNKDHDIWDLIK